MRNSPVTVSASDAAAQTSDLGHSNPVLLDREHSKSNPVAFNNLDQIAQDLEFYAALRDWKAMFSLQYTDNHQLNPHVIAPGQRDLIAMLKTFVVQISIGDLCSIMSGNPNSHPKLTDLIQSTLNDKLDNRESEQAAQDNPVDLNAIRAGAFYGLMMSLLGLVVLAFLPFSMSVIAMQALNVTVIPVLNFVSGLFGGSVGALTAMSSLGTGAAFVGASFVIIGVGALIRHYFPKIYKALSGAEKVFRAEAVETVAQDNPFAFHAIEEVFQGEAEPLISLMQSMDAAVARRERALDALQFALQGLNEHLTKKFNKAEVTLRDVKNALYIELLNTQKQLSLEHFDDRFQTLLTSSDDEVRDDAFKGGAGVAKLCRQVRQVGRLAAQHALSLADETLSEHEAVVEENMVSAPALALAVETAAIPDARHSDDVIEGAVAVLIDPSHIQVLPSNAP